MNTIERALTHALFVHLHHNIDQAVDFRMIEELNRKVSLKWPGALTIGPGDDAAVFQMPGCEG
ncbi:MAG: phosphoribosylformylglycinamidine synthase, partial [Chloroflexi bacterium]|nr:phosphoribosylformylglycinamidine synthase [Chloroflexota bacterium]